MTPPCDHMTQEDLRHVEEVLQSELIELRTGGPNIPREIDSIKKQQT